MQPDLPARGATISVPASIANLGPGLDTLALAVRLFLHLRVRKSQKAGANRLQFHFRNIELQGENLIDRAFRHLAARRRFPRSEEHASELQSPCNLVCRLL